MLRRGVKLKGKMSGSGRTRGVVIGEWKDDKEEVISGVQKELRLLSLANSIIDNGSIVLLWRSRLIIFTTEKHNNASRSCCCV
jgi:hypothetical protein